MLSNMGTLLFPVCRFSP
uniref:Uncharacterized protein n=1 Tax=Arundo donax TaxID=35708 RepID=A0A0A9GX73_ARUDO